MRVGLNATCFNDRPSGARQRFVGIYGALIRAHPEIDFVIYEPRDCAVAGWFGGLPNVEARPTPLPSEGRLKRLRASLGFWRSRLREDRLDLFEQFNLPMVKAPDCPTLLTVHDMRQIEPGTPALARSAARMIWHRTYAQADHVITVSDTMAANIRAFRPGTPVTTVYNGLDSAPFAGVGKSEAAETANRLGLPGDFILAVGHLEPRKNYERLIAAVAALEGQHPDLGLAIVGNDGGSGPAIAAEIERDGLGGRVRLLSNVPDSDLVRLYRACRLFAFPSTYEGFGIPILEAMAAGRPFAISELPVFREISQGQGFFFDPLNVPSITAALRRGLEDEAGREALERYGPTRVKDFRFPTLAGQVHDLYRKLTGTAGRAWRGRSPSAIAETGK